jgi:hypothetical protein
MKILLIFSCAVFLSTNVAAQFSTTVTNWNVPDVETNSEDLDQISGTNHALFDINGDGFPDLIDTEDNATDITWTSGSQKYWKVYLNNGSSISSTATNWNVPDVETNSEDMDQISGTNHALFDINGDGFPDLIDTEDNATDITWTSGSQKYWKVYLNNGSSISSTATNWNVPDVETNSEDMDQISGTNHALFDINGDGFPDLIDTEDNATDITWTSGSQKYWKVYLNNGSSISSTATNWNVPDVETNSEDMDQISGTNHALFDINGDGFPDLIDSEDNATDITWTSGSQKYWKVYLNNGSSISSTATNWNVPDVETNSEDMDQISGTNHALFDINGDGFPDLIDSEDNATDITWTSGSQKYWKVYLNNGSSISSTATNWNVPDVETNSEDMDQISGTNHALFDINGDGFPDLIDSEDNATDITWTSGSQKYWKVYLNNSPSNSGFQILNNRILSLNGFPNPTHNNFSINLSELPSPSICIYNSSGKLIYIEHDIVDGLFSYDLSSYDSGMFFIKITTSHQTFNSKIIKK